MINTHTIMLYTSLIGSVISYMQTTCSNYCLWSQAQDKLPTGIEYKRIQEEVLQLQSQGLKSVLVIDQYLFMENKILKMSVEQM